jgi:hypothetical protein
MNRSLSAHKKQRKELNYLDQYFNDYYFATYMSTNRDKRKREIAKQDVMITRRGPVELYRRDACDFDDYTSDRARMSSSAASTHSSRRRHGSSKYRRPMVACYDTGVDFDYVKPNISYRQALPEPYYKRGHLPVSGDKLVQNHFTRRYIYHRTPFDWYNSERAVIIDDIEEIVPLPGTLETPHVHSLYGAPDGDGCYGQNCQSVYDLECSSSMSGRSYGDYDSHHRRESTSRDRYSRSPPSRNRSYSSSDNLVYKNKRYESSSATSGQETTSPNREKNTSIMKKAQDYSTTNLVTPRQETTNWSSTTSLPDKKVDYVAPVKSISPEPASNIYQSLSQYGSQATNSSKDRLSAYKAEPTSNSFTNVSGLTSTNYGSTSASNYDSLYNTSSYGTNYEANTKQGYSDLVRQILIDLRTVALEDMKIKENNRALASKRVGSGGDYAVSQSYSGYNANNSYLPQTSSLNNYGVNIKESVAYGEAIFKKDSQGNCVPIKLYAC